MTSLIDGIDKTLEKKRGYRLGNYRTHYQIDEENDAHTFELEHYGTIILKAQKVK